jgi:hypothetical protein
MRRRPPPAIVLAVLAPLCLAAPAAAETAVLGSPISLTVTAPAPGVRAHFVVATPASGGTALGVPVAAGWAEPVAGGLRFTLPAGSLPARRAGRYVWRASTYAADGDVQLAGTPVQPLEVATPAAWQRRTRIPRRLGRQGRGSFALARGSMPGGVPSGRLASIASLAAWRWGLRARGWSAARPGRADRRNVVGFGPGVPAGALGMQRDLVADVWRRGRRCRTTRRNGRVVARRCVDLPPVHLGRQLVEQDIVLRPDVPWAAGPQPPALDQFDLETVLVHELGHFAGNKSHRPRCENSPMAEALAPGEWWHTERDRFSFCFAARPASALLGPRPRPLRLVHRTVVVRRIVSAR